MRVLDYFIHPQLSQTSDMHYQSRILVGILLTYILLLCFCNIYFILLAPLEPYSVLTSSCITITLQIVWLLCLYQLKSKGRYTVCAQISIASTAISIFTGIFLSGGPIDSPFVTLSLIPIIMAFILVSRNQGLVWAQISLLAHAIFLSALFFNFDYPQFLNMNHLGLHHSLNWVIAYGAITGLMAVFKTLNQHLSKERDAKHQHLEYLATHDPLTQLANRSLFDASLNAALGNARKKTQQVGLLFIDLDNFKPINDLHGHEIGDKVLKIVARKMQSVVRKTDTIARIGGDEFAIIVEQSQKREIQQIAQKLKNALLLRIPDLPQNDFISASIGVALYPEDGKSAQTLTAAADKAMYSCKQQKKESIQN